MVEQLVEAVLLQMIYIYLILEMESNLLNGWLFQSSDKHQEGDTDTQLFSLNRIFLYLPEILEVKQSKMFGA